VDLDLDCVASYLVLLEEGHYGRAAHRLSLTRGALTRRVQRLEGQLGVVLLDRGTAGVVGPTGAGRQFGRDAVPLLALAAATADAARRAAVDRTVRLGVPGDVGELPRRSELTNVGRELARTCPEMRLQVVGIPFTRLIGGLLDGHVDIVLTAGHRQPQGVTSVPLVGVPRVGVVHRQHDLAGATSCDVDTFARLPMLYDRETAPDWMSLWYLGDVRPARHAQLVDVRAPGVTKVLHRAAAGPQVTVMPGPLAARLPTGLCAVPLSGVPDVVFTATHRRADRRETVQAVVAAVQRVVRRSYGAPGEALPL
jgi:DNA-binding transcriptional LysR family regulator